MAKFTLKKSKSFPANLFNDFYIFLKNGGNNSRSGRKLLPEFITLIKNLYSCQGSSNSIERFFSTLLNSLVETDK